LTVVPSELRSMMKNAPDAESRRMRACSRDTSTDASIRTSARKAMPPRPTVTESLSMS